MARASGALLATTVGFVLACGGVRPTHHLDRAGFTIDLPSGTVTDDSDNGAEGDYDVEFGLSTESLSWQPADTPVVEHVDGLWEAAQLIVQGEDDVALGTPVFTNGTVAGQRSRRFVVLVSGATLISTTWVCPQSGVMVTLNSTGVFGVEDRHADALETVTCKLEPAELVIPPSWSFHGGPGWTDESSTEVGSWTKDDVHVQVVGMSRLDDDGSVCAAALEIFLRNQEILEVAPAGPTRPAPPGCEQTGTGVTVDGESVAYLLRYRQCPERGQVLLCQVPHGHDTAACEGVVGCP